MFEKCARLTEEDYNGYIWGHNGPIKVTKIFHDFCKIPEGKITGDFKCDSLDLYIFPFTFAYAVWYRRAANLFYPLGTKSSLELIKNSHFVHLNSHVSKNYTIQKDSASAFNILNEKLCPKIREISDSKFE
jgi:hypothetical protein